MTTFTPRVKRALQRLKLVDEDRKIKEEHIPDNLLTEDEIDIKIDEKIAELKI